jgi:hypothetical protein
MLEAHIQIDDDLAAKGYRRALQSKAIADICNHYAKNLLIVYMFVAAADAILDAPDLIWSHFLCLCVLWVFACIYGYSDWTKRVAQTRGWSFHAKLDELGVTTDNSQETRNNWNFYTSYKEYEDYLQIDNSEGAVTFLPKTPELFEIVEFTKQKIPRR